MPALTTVGDPAVVDSTSRNVLFSAGGISWKLQGHWWSGNMGRSSRLHNYYKINVLIISCMQLASLSSYTGHDTLTVAIKHS